ncbi:MAG: PilZ domain-containing protein [Nitrospiraceae bacterium]
MPFIIRPFRRFPVQCPVSYHAGLSLGQGTLWNFSVNGWKLSGDVPLHVGQMCSLTVTLPNQPSFVVSAAIVRWARDKEYGLETLAIDKQVHSRLEQVIKQLEQASGESVL